MSYILIPMKDTRKYGIPHTSAFPQPVRRRTKDQRCARSRGVSEYYEVDRNGHVWSLIARRPLQFYSSYWLAFHSVKPSLSVAFSNFDSLYLKEVQEVIQVLLSVLFATATVQSITRLFELVYIHVFLSSALPLLSLQLWQWSTATSHSSAVKPVMETTSNFRGSTPPRPGWTPHLSFPHVYP